MGQYYQILDANSIGESVALAIRESPDLVLYDWLFEKKKTQGFEKLHQILNSLYIPIIAIANKSDLMEVYGSGVTDYVDSELNPVELSFRVKSALTMYKLHKGILDQNRRLETEGNDLLEAKRKSEELLLNILPYEVAEQLKNKGKVKPTQYRKVSIIFTDFKGFTKISEEIGPEEIMSALDHLFGVFDEITGKHYLEKLKTIGDAYMCAGGLPLRNNSNPINAVLASLEIQDYMRTHNESLLLAGLQPWYLRVGIHTGKVIAGVIGKKKFAYDIWGDTVNTASRMESSGLENKVNISGETYKYIKDFFDCTYRGKIEAKNKGHIDMYFVDRIKPEYAADNYGMLPNNTFLELLSEF
jgi:class 3 adenylate cyclase